MEFPRMQNAEIESETPSYLEVLHESNTILIRKKKQGYDDANHNSLNMFAHNEAEDLDLTGTPLDCPFQTNDELNTSLVYDFSTVSWRKNEENHFPFKITDAIQFLSTYNLDYKRDDNSRNKTVWVALDSKDSRKTVLMGLLIDGDWQIRKTVCQGKIPLTGVEAFGRSIREKYLKMSGAKEIKSRCKVFVVYDVVRKSPKNETDDDVVGIKLCSTWRPSLNDLTSPPPEANTTLSLEMKTGSEQSKIHHLWNQLLFLNELVSATSCKEVAFPKTVVARGDTMERVVDLVKARESCEVKCSGLAAKDSNFETIAEVLQSEQDTCDFPGKLWELLICCQSCSELVACFEYVFEEAEKGTIMPYIHPQDTSKFSKLIIDLSMGVPLPKYFSLSEASSLDMLKEMGLNALQQSYTHILLTCDWCSSYQLDNDIPKCNQMARLGQLHVLLDLFLTTQQHMNLPLKCIKSLFSIAIVKYLAKFHSFEEVLEHRHLTFSQALSMTDVACHLTKQFTSWELQIETDPQNENLRLSTICHVANEPIFPPPLALPVLEDSDAEHDEISMFTTQLTVIGNKISNNFAVNCNF